MNSNNRLKKFIKNKGYSIKNLSTEADLPYSTVNDIVNGVVSVDNVGLGKCKAIADALDVTLDEFYDLYNNVISVGDDGHVVVKNHGYYLRYKDKEKYIFKANNQNAFFVKEVATWDYEDMIAQEELNRLSEEAIQRDDSRDDSMVASNNTNLQGKLRGKAELQNDK